jgi:LacI family transcriptional regulator
MRRKRIGILTGAWAGYFRDSVQGIGEYARESGSWTLVCNLLDKSLTLESIESCNLDGLLCHLTDPTPLVSAQASGMAIVNMLAANKDLVPSVHPDNVAIGRLAAEYFSERHYRRFAFMGLTGRRYSDDRLAGFKARLAELGFGLVSEGQVPLHSSLGEVVQFLKSLPRGTALFCGVDRLGQAVISQAQELGRRVPDELAVLGVDNDILWCSFCDPPLTSIDNNSFEVGYESARLLDAIMSGTPGVTSPVLVLPKGIVERQSTDACGIEDDVIRSATRWIAAHQREPFSVATLAQAIAVSRRLVERRFRERLGTTVWRYQIDLRLREAQRLLLDPRLSIAEIAESLGFRDYTELSRTMKKNTGLSPRAFQRQQQALSSMRP